MKGAVMIVVSALLFAGCAAPETAGPSDEDAFNDVDLRVSDTTGAILGVVVDDTITPVPGAAVVLQGGTTGDAEQVTDEHGRFAYDELPGGTYFIKVTKSLHETVQTSVTVQAGVEKPPVLDIMLPRVYQIEPFTIAIKQAGFFTCSQNGLGYYSSSPCTSVTPYTNEYTDPLSEQAREWHSDVPAGWLSQVFEMTWQSSATGTAPGMGLVVSSYKPERSGTHSFANYQSTNPMRFEINLGEAGPGAAAGGGPMGATIPEEGMENMSYFASVRSTDPFPLNRAIAIDQKFTVYIHQFIACEAPDGWSIVEGDEDPC